MHLINIYYPWSDYVLAGICDVVSVYERPEIEKGHYIVRCLKPLFKAELSEQQQQVVDKHFLLGNFSPKNRPKYGRILGIVEVDGCSRKSKSVWNQGDEFFKMKIRRVYQLKIPLSLEEYLSLFDIDELPSLDYVEEIPLQK